MDTVVTAAGMGRADRAATRRLGVSSALLMENAGREVALAVRSLPGARRGPVTIVCGKGSNGGDGFVAARHLLEAGVPVLVVLIGRPGVLRGDARDNYRALVSIMRTSAEGRLRVLLDPAGRKLGRTAKPAAIVDAIVGTGFSGDLRGGVLGAVQWINRSGVPVLAVDIPTGLEADDGSVGNGCVRADRTVTMGFVKRGMLLGRGPEVCGSVSVAGLGVALPVPGGREVQFRVGEADVRAAMPHRAFDAHKHHAGKVLVIAGSTGYTGAAALTASAAMRAGAGAVVLATPAEVYPILARKLTEVMVKPLEGGGVGYSASMVRHLERDLAWADVTVVGPGMGAHPGTELFLEALFRRKNRLRTTGFLIDADALTVFGRNPFLRGVLRRRDCVLTPHLGEFSRLTGIPAEKLQEKRSDHARRFAQAHEATLVLKGAPTLTVSAEGDIYINPTGNRGMASAGMGDVLAGIIAALWAESRDALTASWAGVYLHGAAGDEAAGRLGYRSLMAGDLLKSLPKVLKKYGS